jgi:aminopeptidase-like protein
MRAFDTSISSDNLSIGREAYDLVAELYPICRSITGEGVRQTLAIIGKHIPIQVHEIPSGTNVFDWTVPKEWNIHDAYIKNNRGERVVDFQKSNLHVVNYSVPIRRKITLLELKKHLHTLADNPDWIPYRTSYYNETWGFCLSQNQLDRLGEEEYEVYIDSSLQDGSLTYGEYYLRGKSPKEVLIFTHVCHPSLCNDNLSGIAVVTLLGKYLRQRTIRYSYRLVFAPATIGSITWLSVNESRLGVIDHGLVLVLVGDPGKLTYKKSRSGVAEIDRAVEHTLKHRARNYDILEFSPYGYDERQFCSPGINLPVGRLTRTPNACYPQYHTSADDLLFVKPEALGESFMVAACVLETLEGNMNYTSKNPKCEPQLGRRGLYRATGGKTLGDVELSMLWVLNLSDGTHSLLDIAERSGLPFQSIRQAADMLLAHDLLEETVR